MRPSQSQRITARQRIRHRSDFAAVRAEGIRHGAGVFLMQVLMMRTDAAEGPHRRLGVIASRRVGGAVVRNRAKRVFREIFRIHQHALPEHCDTVIVVRRGFDSFSMNDLAARFLNVCARLGQS